MTKKKPPRRRANPQPVDTISGKTRKQLHSEANDGTDGLHTLFHRDAKKKLRFWRVWVEGADVCSMSGLCVDEEGTESEKATDARRTCVAKNVGRTTATTPEEQAKREAKADWEYKRKRKYREEIPGPDAVLTDLPMLAKPFWNKDGTLTPAGKKASYPVDVQPKLDGGRIKAGHGEFGIELLSRNGLPYFMVHIIQQLTKWMPTDMELDGELYLHGLSVQQITSLAKDPRRESLALKYHVYDMPRFEGNADLPWHVRRDLLAEHLQESASVVHVGHVTAESDDDVRVYHDRFRERGFEGAIVRLHEGKYRYAVRSGDLLKVKAFQAAEFVVVGCEQGVGKDVGTATFVLDVGDGRTFKARMKGTIDERRAFWDLRASYKGEKLTVEFFGLTDEGKPFHPTGVVFRDVRDLPQED